MTSKGRDNLVIISVMVLVVAGYFLFKNPGGAPLAEDHSNVRSMGQALSSLGELPDDYNGLIETGNDYMDHGNYAMAAECYRRALALDSSSLDVRTDYGACLHGMGLLERARDEFARVLEKNPHHPIANFNQGIVYLDMKMNDSTRIYWERYLALEPEGTVAESVREFLKRMNQK